MTIVSVGEITIDRYVGLNASYVGGISLNFAVQARRCGADAVSLVSRVGNDGDGQRVLDTLKREDVDASRIAVVPGKTASCAIQIVPGGERIYPHGGYQANVLSGFRLGGADIAFIHRHDVLVSRLDCSQREPFFDQAMTVPFKGKRVADFGDWMDYGGNQDPIRAYLDRLDIAFISGNREAIEALAPFALRYGVLVVVTLGPSGSVALRDGKMVFQPACPAPDPVDATGCGDAFQAAFTVAWLRTGEIEYALRRGADHAASVIGHYGAIGV